ncbi:hypothetical protein TRIUR3_05998 [Triticum urartu]|uniref:Uncharacterized protein n=1 Tax=Triticum urartu TaxID=4572 RepID=M8A5T4_TRIUA|nr:hypothetical protein TRIUR3_05998 [Triticum urartu]
MAERARGEDGGVEPEGVVGPYEPGGGAYRPSGLSAEVGGGGAWPPTGIGVPDEGDGYDGVPGVLCGGKWDDGVLELDGGVGAPWSRLPLTSNTVTFFSSPTCGGTQPVSMSSMSTISLSVSAILPMEGGMHPPSRLCASTTTEAGELPRLAGMGLRRRLELRKMASSGRSKSAGGMEPSKSLKRRSRYLRDGSASTTSGKAPTKRLLLRSSSWSRRKRRKVSGTTPQKRLELRCSSARSGSPSGREAGM